MKTIISKIRKLVVSVMIIFDDLAQSLKIFVLDFLSIPYEQKLVIKEYERGGQKKLPNIIEFLDNLSIEFLSTSSNRKKMEVANTIREINNEELIKLFNKKPCDKSDVIFQLYNLLYIYHTYKYSHIGTEPLFILEEIVEEMKWKDFYFSLL